MRIQTVLHKFLIFGLLSVVLAPALTQAAGEISPRSVTATSSAGAAGGVSYTLKFNAGTAGNVGSIKFQICDSPAETTPCAGTGTSAGASLANGGLGGVFSGPNWSTPIWTRSAQTGPGVGGTSVSFTANAPVAVTTGNQATVVLSNVINPTAVNKEYYFRITTYSDTGLGVEVDYGAVAMSTAQAVTVSGVMPESLVFCVGTVWTTDCTDIAGSAVDLGTFSPTSTNTGTSVMSASTNAASGYVITTNGTTMTSGLNTIPAMGTQSLDSAGCAVSCTSVTGTSQYGSNIVANNLASAGGAFGADVSGTGTATPFGGYANTNAFRFFSGDTVASVGGPTNTNLFTNSYIVNVGGSQAAGLYTSTMTYICTASF